MSKETIDRASAPRCARRGMRVARTAVVRRHPDAVGVEGRRQNDPEAARFLREHWVDAENRALIGGRVPINPHGGSLSEGGTRGTGHLREAVVQLRDEAGARRVPARAGCSSRRAGSSSTRRARCCAVRDGAGASAA